MRERAACRDGPDLGLCLGHSTFFSQILAGERAAAEASQAATVDAHVVAPCPHDGGCPMDGTRTWCHFVQRFERGRLQQQVKALPGAPQQRLTTSDDVACIAFAYGNRDAGVEHFMPFLPGWVASAGYEPMAASMMLSSKVVQLRGCRNGFQCSRAYVVVDSMLIVDVYRALNPEGVSG